jgi:hypothetical protein
MQTDFHFYAVYALARAAGFNPEDSHIVAYSSEHTDDAKYEHVLNFENGGRFQQVLTAHRYLHHKVGAPETCYRIWLPFHFLPGNLGVDFYERMITRPGGPVAKRLIDDLLSANHRPYFLHRLGILLHCYADTWSHQNFLGVTHATLNKVRRLKIVGLSHSDYLSHLRWLKKRFTEYTLPGLGHAQAGTIPDEPYREWEYQNYASKKQNIINSLRALDAAQNCYEVLLGFLAAFADHYSHGSTLPWHELAINCKKLFQNSGDRDTRIKAWKDAISGNCFGFRADDRDRKLNYDDREWFKEAVTVKQCENNSEHYERKGGFETSNWKYFHDAAAFHRFTVLHEVLPEHGMICG